MTISFNLSYNCQILSHVFLNLWRWPWIREWDDKEKSQSTSTYHACICMTEFSRSSLVFQSCNYLEAEITRASCQVSFSVIGFIYTRQNFIYTKSVLLFFYLHQSVIYTSQIYLHQSILCTNQFLYTSQCFLNQSVLDIMRKCRAELLCWLLQKTFSGLITTKKRTD